MKKMDEALSLPNPRLLTAIYFSLLAVIATLSIDTLLYWMGVIQFVTVSDEIMLGVLVAGCFGALFGERIVHSPKPYGMHVFLWAFLMAIIALPIYNIGFLYLMKENHAEFFKQITIEHILSLYLFVSVYSFILAGVWLAILAGFAALFLRGYLVYYIKHSLYKERDIQHGQDSPKKTSKQKKNSH